MALHEVPNLSPEYHPALAERGPNFKEWFMTEVLGPARMELRNKEEVAEQLSEYAQKHNLYAFFNEFQERDKDTFLHEMRVAAIGLDLAMDETKKNDEIKEYFEAIGVGLFLHDTGKPDMDQSLSILKKPGALIPEERAIIEGHPALGLMQLMSDPRLASSLAIKGVKEIVALHHANKKNRIDARGEVMRPYPVDLSQKETLPDTVMNIDLKNMPEVVRHIIKISAAADSYDALADLGRGYHKTIYGKEEISELIALDQNLPEDLIKEVASRFPKGAAKAAAAAA